MNSENIVLPLKRFLLVEECPAPWEGYDLYLFRDESVVFYVGQSQLALARVWEHLLSGFKGHSIVGRFIWFNWPKSLSSENSTRPNVIHVCPPALLRERKLLAGTIFSNQTSQMEVPNVQACND